ncbi:MAG: hypothetical protein Unbinned465contig1000_22 [Prokaryotic dsDNA virus sp.]|nr:MAG: hypothetical protein Unbinned465contig1000_22 [Prokaryotic dsDNA virus sp.]|tara:strand:- start:7889 stop:8398 length:510 start_codon:yes stop_codon:yes gene_type:complete
MSFKLPSIAPPRGVQLDQYVVTLRNGTSGTVTKGEVVVLDLANAGSAVSDNQTDAGLTSGFVNFADVNATEANNGPGIYGILLEDITAGNLGKVCLSGVVDAQCDGGSADIALNDALVADLVSTVGQLQTGAVDADNAVIGIALAANTAAGSTSNLTKVLFDGFAIQRA